MKQLTTFTFLALLFMLMTSQRCQDEDYKLPDGLMGSWVHSHEEDYGGNMVYRRPSFDFPPSRGRERFDIIADGKVRYWGIAPTDGMADPVDGKWESVTERTISVRVPKQPGNSFTAELVEITPSRLVLRKVEDL